MAFSALGYESAHHGQGQWNGVAILSKVGLDDVVPGFADGADPDADARLITATCGGVSFSSVYVPNGRAVGHDHYHYKLAWFARLGAHLAAAGRPDGPVVVCGDFNVAPEDRDVWDPKAFEGSTHVTPARARGRGDAGGLGARGRLPPVLARRRQAVHLLGLPRRRLPPAPRHAHRPRAGHRAGRRAGDLVRGRPQRPQGHAALGPRAARGRPGRATRVAEAQRPRMPPVGPDAASRLAEALAGEASPTMRAAASVAEATRQLIQVLMATEAPADDLERARGAGDAGRVAAQRRPLAPALRGLRRVLDGRGGADLPPVQPAGRPGQPAGATASCSASPTSTSWVTWCSATPTRARRAASTAGSSPPPSTRCSASPCRSPA